MPATHDIATAIPPELQLPVPRQVRQRGTREHAGRGYISAAGVIFAFLCAYLAWRWAHLLTRRPVHISSIIFLTIGILFCAMISWLLLPLRITSFRKWRLVRDGKPIVGRIIQKRLRYRRSLDIYTCYLDFEYEHPGLGRRRASMSIDEDEWAAVAQGADVIVLCYPHRRRPILLYEHCILECVPAPGAPRVKQPTKASFKSYRLKAQPTPGPYVFPPELKRPAPRKTVRKPQTMTIGLISARVLWFGIAAFGLFTVARIGIYALVTYRGQVIEGRVEGTTDSGHPPVYLGYYFEVAGQRHDGAREIDKTMWLKPGQTIPVHVGTFAGRTYSVVTFPGESRFSNLIDPIMESFSYNFLLTLLVGIPVWILPWVEKRLCRRGTPVIGQITRKNIRRRRRSGPSYVQAYELYYEFQHPKLGLKSSRTDVSILLYEKAHVGETVTILCNPRRHDPYTSTMYEYGNFICV